MTRYEVLFFSPYGGVATFYRTIFGAYLYKIILRILGEKAPIYITKRDIKP